MSKRAAIAEREERRSRPREDRPVISAEERALGKGWWLTVDSWPAEMLQPLARAIRYENNPRLNDEAVDDVMVSLNKFGARQPIVLDEGDVIVVGDTRFMGAERLGWPKFPMHVAAGLSPEEAKAYRIADNKVGEKAEWDFGRLKLEFEGLAAMGADLSITGFKDFEIQPIIDSQWTAPAQSPLPSGGGEGEKGKPEGKGDEGQPRLTFDPIQWDRVQQAAERFRGNIQRPDLAAAEIVTRLCIDYLARSEPTPAVSNA